MSEYKLSEGIVNRSVADNWDEAKLEWRLESIFESDESRTCLCGHYPIKEICVLVNKNNGSTTEVGNTCVNKFLGISSNKLFQSLKRVKRDPSKAFTFDMVDLFHRLGHVTDRQRTFYRETWRRRSLTERDMDTRRQINKRILRELGNRDIDSLAKWNSLSLECPSVPLSPPLANLPESATAPDAFSGV